MPNPKHPPLGGLGLDLFSGTAADTNKAIPVVNGGDSCVAEQDCNGHDLYRDLLGATAQLLTNIRTYRDLKVPNALPIVQAALKGLQQDEFGFLQALSGERAREEYEYGHALNVCVLSMVIGRTMGLGRQSLQALGLGALLQDMGKVQEGDVLVIPYSDVGWTPLFTKAGAVIAESGGILSHSSIVAREYGIPAVVSVPGATQLPDGTQVTVDGYLGEIIVHELTQG